VIVLRTPPALPGEAAVAAAASRLALVKNAIDAVKSDTSLVRVPMALPTQGGMVVAEAMVPLAVEARLATRVAG